MMRPRFDEVLTPAALNFLADLHRRYDRSRIELLKIRVLRHKAFEKRSLPNFLPETKDIRTAEWRIRDIPADLQDRRVEITGPADRSTIASALNSDAKTFIADFEDATSPTFQNVVEGQIALKDRWSGTLGALPADPPALIVRPRGWHMPEAHILVDGKPMAGAFVDFGLYAFHNARAIWKACATPAFYLPKLESHLEARLWRDVLSHTESALGLPHGSFKATVLIETLAAAFEMDEILYELRDHAAGLSCGGWDIIFSAIKRLGKHQRFITPDRSAMVMSKAFLRAISLLLIQTCHRRGALAIGGLSAEIPADDDPLANEAAFAKVRAGKEREAGDGHDGTWVAHPALVPAAMEVFDRLAPAPNQLHRLREDVTVTRHDMLAIHEGRRTEAGLRENIRIGVRYIAAWLDGRGAVPLSHLMEDAATAEVCRVQVWQWLYHRAALDDGRSVTMRLVLALYADEMAKLQDTLGAAAFSAGRFEEAGKLFLDLSLAEECSEFFTLSAYGLLSD